TAALIADYFLVGWTALLLLPPLALLAPHVREAPGDPKARPQGWRRVKWRIAVLISAALTAFLGGLWYQRAAGGAWNPLILGSGWFSNATGEATRHAPWTLVLTPLMLYPWIGWKTLWRAFARQTRQGYGFGIRICLIFLAAAFVS